MQYIFKTSDIPVQNGGTFLSHLTAFTTVCIWGLTFVSTKILIALGLSPTEIFIYRFLIAYLCILTISHKRLLSDSAKDEALLFLAGLSGGSLYFITENYALRLTPASDVSLLICTSPIFTILLGYIFLNGAFRYKMIIGTLLALCGVGFVVFNGTVNLGIHPLGHILTMTAALLWAVYSIILEILGNRYPIFFVTRKVFFYGIVSAATSLMFRPEAFDICLLLHPAVCANLLFLELIASMLCYIMWNHAVLSLGAEKAANYIYISPMVTIMAAILFLDEPMTAFTVMGTISIIAGVYLAERG